MVRRFAVEEQYYHFVAVTNPYCMLCTYLGVFTITEVILVNDDRVSAIFQGDALEGDLPGISSPTLEIISLI